MPTTSSSVDSSSIDGRDTTPIPNGFTSMPTTSSSVDGRDTTPIPKRRRNLDHAATTVDVDAVSPKKPRVTVDQDWLACPICYYFFQPPIYQCENGHLVCESCCKKIHNKCPSCSLPVGTIRCRAIERIVESTFTSCENEQYGCKEKISYLAKPDHEKTCKYIPIRCPVYKCGYLGAQSYINTHFANKHRTCVNKFSFNTVTTVSINKGGFCVLQESDEQIVFVLQRVVNPLGSFVNLTCFAPTRSNMKFSYELSAKIGDKIVSVISPVELTLSVTLDKNKCLLIPNEYHYLKDGISSLILNLVVRKIS